MTLLLQLQSAVLLALLCLPTTSNAFTTTGCLSPTRRPSSPRDTIVCRFSAAEAATSSLSVREIKDELRERGIKFDDCFDKESLVQRLQEARDGKVQGTATAADVDTTQQPNDASSSKSKQATQSADTSSSSSSSSSEPQSTALDKETVLAELRSMRVKELRHELASRGRRWAGLLEKEDLVQAVWQTRQAAATFSATGLLTPGQVAALSGDQVQQEASATHVDAPLLVDAYATWCGPCQIMAPQLQAAAETWGNAVRVAKLDTDAHPVQASQWQIQGLPTLLLFKGGNLVARIEGALMKDQLLQWVEAELAKV